jgi:hypothetical protein
MKADARSALDFIKIHAYIIETSKHTITLSAGYGFDMDGSEIISLCIFIEACYDQTIG